MKNLLLIIFSSAIVAVNAATPQLKVVPHPAYGFPLIKMNNRIIAALTMQLHGKTGRIAEQSPYSPSPLDIKKIEKHGNKSIIMGGFNVGESIFEFIETVEKEAKDTFLVTYLITPRQDSAFTVRLYGGIDPKTIFAVKTDTGKNINIPTQKNMSMPSVKLKKQVRAILTVNKKILYLIPCEGIGIVQLVDKRKWNQGVRLQLFSRVSKWRKGKMVKANDSLYISFKVSLIKPKLKSNIKNKR